MEMLDTLENIYLHISIYQKHRNKNFLSYYFYAEYRTSPNTCPNKMHSSLNLYPPFYHLIFHCNEKYNIIFILSESFFDITKLNDEINFDGDILYLYLLYYHAIHF